MCTILKYFRSERLKSYLPDFSDWRTSIQTGAVSASPNGPMSLLTIPWAYLRMMGKAGLRKASTVALINANYMMKRLSPFYPIPFQDTNGLCAHEFLVDLREITKKTAVSATDVAKRLQDYGFHAPTVEWPIIGTLLIEPTESENMAEIDRYIGALVKIREEISDIESGKFDLNSSVFKNAPHTQRDVCDDKWKHSYSRAQAVYPLEWLMAKKVWPARNRIDDVFGDLNLVCSKKLR